MELASPSDSGSPDLRHLHNQQFQPSRADNSGGKGGCACWGTLCPGRMLAWGPAGSPKGCGLTRVIVCSSLSCGLSPPPPPQPSSLRSHSCPAAGRMLCKHRTRGTGNGGASCRRARRSQCYLAGTNAHPSLVRSLTASQMRQPINLKRHNCRTTGYHPGKESSPCFSETATVRPG